MKPKVRFVIAEYALGPGTHLHDNKTKHVTRKCICVSEEYSKSY